MFRRLFRLCNCVSYVVYGRYIWKPACKLFQHHCMVIFIYECPSLWQFQLVNKSCVNRFENSHFSHPWIASLLLRLLKWIIVNILFYYSSAWKQKLLFVVRKMVCIPSIQKPILLILLPIRYVCVSISPWSHVLILFPLALEKNCYLLWGRWCIFYLIQKVNLLILLPIVMCFNFPVVARFTFVPFSAWFCNALLASATENLALSETFSPADVRRHMI